MSSKKKAFKPHWVELEDGKYILESGKVLDHNSSFNTSFSSKERNLSLNQPTISNGVFCGEILLKPPKELKLPISMKKDFVDLNPLTMQLCKIAIGGPVIVYLPFHNSMNMEVYRAWPSNQVPLGKLGLSDCYMKKMNIKVGEYLQVTKSPNKIQYANSLTLAVISNQENENQSILTSSHFQNYMSNILDRTYVIERQRIDVFYFGKTFQFRVENIIFRSLEEFESTSDLEKSFSSFNLNSRGSKSDISLTELQTSTPLKSSGDGLNITSFKENKSFQNKIPQVYMITSNTVIKVMNNSNIEDGENIEDKLKLKFDNIGGLKEAKKTLLDIVCLPIKYPKLFADAGIHPSRGVILHGPSGTGKSMLTQAISHEAGMNMLHVRGSEVMSRFFGESEKKLQSIFDDAQKNAPCIVIVDELDSICPRRDTTRTDVEKRLVSAFITILDNLGKQATQSGSVVVVATTNRIHSVEPALRRAGRFDREIEVGIPTTSDRAEILSKLLSQSNHNITSDEINSISEKAHGYVGADLSAVCVEAGLNAVKRRAEGGSVEQVMIEANDLEHGLVKIPPSAMRELIVQVPQVKWSDIGGNESVKKKLRQAIEWPLKNPGAFTRLGIDPPRGVLMYGPPGCSKTLTAKALATESGLNFISIKGPELFSKFVGDSERAIRQIFSKARSAAPSIVFFDELDALATERGSGNAVADRVLAAMLTEMDGVEQRNDVIVVAATNRPDMIDKALLRPGRIDRILYVPLPDKETRGEIFRIQFRKIPTDDDVSLEELVQRTEMYSGAEICSVCREAALAALDDDLAAVSVSKNHFDSALKGVLPQTTREKARTYDEYGKTLQTSIK